MLRVVCYFSPSIEQMWFNNDVQSTPHILDFSSVTDKLLNLLHSCIFHPCCPLPHCPQTLAFLNVSHFPLPHFQSPRRQLGDEYEICAQISQNGKPGPRFALNARLWACGQTHHFAVATRLRNNRCVWSLVRCFRLRLLYIATNSAYVRLQPTEYCNLSFATIKLQ